MRLIPCMRGQDEDQDHSKQIDREIKQWIKNYNDLSAIKLLLLGTGESGKTTIIKQMKILHIKGFSQSERVEKIQHIRHNVHESIYDIVRNMSRLSIGLASPKNVQAQAYVLRCGPEGPPHYNESKSSSQPLPSVKSVCEPNISTFYSQAAFDDDLPCGQDLDAHLEYAYQQECEKVNKVQEAPKRSKTSKKSSKRKASSGKNKTGGCEFNSFIIKKNKKGLRIIKISISNLEVDNEYEDVAVQYIVESEYDDVLNSTPNMMTSCKRNFLQSCRVGNQSKMRLIPCMRGQDEDQDHSKQIDREIKQWIKNYNDAIKLLLLGTGESGKTTIIKQMKILHIKGFSQSERVEKIQHIRHNVHESIYDIVRNMSRLSIGLANPKNVQAQAYVLRCGPEGPPHYNEEYFDYVRALWRDNGVRECFKRSNEYQLIDSAEYFLDRLDLLEKPDYIPSDADILRCRQKTSGIQKIEFKVKVPKSMQGGIQDFWMFDVGGQRGERKKWIQVFEGIHAIWFLVACSDFDQTLREDSTTNRLKEALTLFEDVWQSRFLLEAGLIVFLNKQDLLQKKVSRGPGIEPYFPAYRDYSAPGDEYDRTKMFIRQMFVDVTQKRRPRPLPPTSAESFVVGSALRPRECYFHLTTATDTDNVREVFRDTHQIILTHVLSTIGVY